MIKLGSHTDWTKSTYSSPNSACVEVRSTAPLSVSLTDSKLTDGPARPVVDVSPAAFGALVSHVRA